MRRLEELELQVRRETNDALAASDVNILEPKRFVSLVRGRPYVQNTGLMRECKIELFMRSELAVMGPVAIFGCRAAGWLDSYEVVLLRRAKRVLCWKRKGNRAEIVLDGRSVGMFKLGWWLRHAYIGSGCVSVGGKPFCNVRLPILGPASPQSRECTGRVTFTSDRKTIRFVINPRDTESSALRMSAGLAWGWARLRGRAAPTPEGSQPGQQSQATIFCASDQTRLAELSDEQRLILLAIALWPWSLYKGGGT